MKIDREFQRNFLERLKEDISVSHFFSYRRSDGKLLNEFENVLYLADHGLVECRYDQPIDDDVFVPYSVRITAKGIDLLEDDGGLSAILGTVTIKFHDDTLRSLLLLKVSEMEISDSRKRAVSEMIRQLSSDCIRDLILRLLDKGIDFLPAALRMAGIDI